VLEKEVDTAGAVGVRSVETTVVDSLSVLFDVFGSGCEPKAPTLLVKVPSWEAMTRSSMVTIAPLARLPNEQITVLPKLHGALENPAVIPAGRLSWTPTLVAVPGPLFLTTMKYEKT
jgi:hypothetical protein